MNPLLGPSIKVNNALCDLEWRLEDHGFSAPSQRVFRVRETFSRLMCQWLLGHPRVIYGLTRDICIDCLTIIDEHPNGRGRTSENEP